ncbi:MAG: hypothetical protein O7E51_10410 [Acidobacteria bacterium]|nr:hypothetical protein [Acidobacteriota bacterium]
MRDLVLLFVHVIATLSRLLGPGGRRSVVAESVLVMDQYTRRIMGFGVHAGTVDGVALCRMFNRAIRWQRWMPNYLSSDQDPLYRFRQWQANLRILEVTEIKTAL